MLIHCARHAGLAVGVALIACMATTSAYATDPVPKWCQGSRSPLSRADRRAASSPTTSITASSRPSSISGQASPIISPTGTPTRC